MTETQLLQMLADVRAVMRAQITPVPYTAINDALAGTDSRDHTRITLRVLDTLVASGELLRHIDTNGGRNTYERAAKTGKHETGPMLLKAFEFDLDGTSPAPATEPAPPAPAASSTAAPAPATPAGSLAQQILDALADGPRTVAQLSDLIPKALGNAVSANLSLLKSKGKVTRSALVGGPWALAENAALEAEATTVSMAPVKQAFEGPIEAISTTVDPIDRALQNLRIRLARKPAAIADLDLKVRTLNRLGELLDPDIRSVLVAISNDLQQVAA